MEFEEGDMECLGQFQSREKVNRHKKFEGKTEKVLKTIFEMQNTLFSRLIQVASQSPVHLPKHFKPKDLKKFVRCFLRLEVSLARESRTELRKSLCTPRDWTFTREQVAKTDLRARDCGIRLG